VRLVDRARADDHRRDAGQGKQAGFGTKGNLAVRAARREQRYEPTREGAMPIRVRARI
jgi:hypothetical protein